MAEAFDELTKQQKDDLINKRISEGWKWQETGVANTDILWPPKDHIANKNSWAAMFLPYKTGFVPQWIVEDHK